MPVVVGADKGTGTLRKPAIATLEYMTEFKGHLADVPLDRLGWPLGRPEGLEEGVVGDLGPQDHLITYPRKWVFGRRAAGLDVRLSLLIAEPRAFDPVQMFLARLFHRRFYRVLTCDDRLLSALPNAQYFVFGDSWVRGWRDTDVTKTKMLSLIASNKKRLKGHRLRHKIVRWIRAEGIEADIMGRGYRPFDDKAQGLAPYRYSVVIENCQQNGYFTEKLVDALLLRTVPIYWGAPDISRFFDMNGIIHCQSEEALRQAIRSVSVADYEARMPAIEANRREAARYADVLKSAARVIESTFPST